MAAFSSIIAGVSALATVATGVAKMASGGPKRPQAAEPFPLNEDQTSVANQLANSFGGDPASQGRIGGAPTLGQSLTGAMNSPQNMRARLDAIGADLGGMIGRRGPSTPGMTGTAPGQPVELPVSQAKLG